VRGIKILVNKCRHVHLTHAWAFASFSWSANLLLAKSCWFVLGQEFIIHLHWTNMTIPQWVECSETTTCLPTRSNIDRTSVVLMEKTTSHTSI